MNLYHRPHSAMDWIRSATLNQTSGWFLSGFADDGMRLQMILAEACDEDVPFGKQDRVRELVMQATWLSALYKLQNSLLFWCTATALLLVPVVQIVNAIWWHVEAPIFTGVVESVIAPIIVGLVLSAYRFRKRRQTDLEDGIRQALFLKERIDEKIARLEEIIDPEAKRGPERQSSYRSSAEIIRLALDGDNLAKHLASLPACQATPISAVALALLLKDAAIKVYSYSWLRYGSLFLFFLAAIVGTLWPLFNLWYRWIPADGFGGAVQSAITMTGCSILFSFSRQYALKIPPVEQAMDDALTLDEPLEAKCRRIVETLHAVDDGLA